MVTTGLISPSNIYTALHQNMQLYAEKAKSYIDLGVINWALFFRPRKKLLRSNYRPLLCILFLLFCLIINQHYGQRRLQTGTDHQIFIDRIRDIAVLDQNFLFNITYQVIINDVPPWISRYRLTHLLNFYWLQSGGYLWHLQRMLDFRQRSTNTFPRSFSKDLFEAIHHHPEVGVIIDTAPDPVQALFSPLPRTSLSLAKTCEQHSWLQDWYPCSIRPEMISSFPIQSLITYALYDVTINDHSPSSPIVHYTEIIYIFQSQEHFHNETIFVRQILPRLIRVMALVPTSAIILLPYLNSRAYINQYVDILVKRGLAANRSRFIEYNARFVYHGDAVYSTSTPRSDLLLLHQVLVGDKAPVRRDLILIIQDQLDKGSYHEIIQTINQFELPEDFEYLHIHEYRSTTYNLTETSEIFRQSRIIIGMPTTLLSHLVWCLPGTHIVEITQPTMTADSYEISLQLKLNYWLAITTAENRVEMTEFRNLMLKVLTNIDSWKKICPLSRTRDNTENIRRRVKGKQGDTLFLFS